MLILPGHPLADPFAGLHHVYADDKALAGVQGSIFADGSTLVFDLLEAEGAEGAIGEGKRKFIGVMVKDEARYGATGGWGYEVFAEGSPDRRLVADGGVSCHACHAQAQDTGYVYSRWRP
jgi:hypothetical protein